jgi:hypothetical protein
MVGLPKEDVRARVKKEYKGFRKDNTIVKQQFNYLKYVNGMKTRTWILYFDDRDICKTSKLVCDYSEFDEVVEDLTSRYNKVDESRWEFVQDGDTFQVVLTKQEWYFTVRETRKEQKRDIEKYGCGN